MEVKRICKWCGKPFIAKKTTTNYCSHQCSSQGYKHRMRERRIELREIQDLIEVKSKLDHQDYFTFAQAAKLMVSCGTKEETWEYKVVKVAGKDAEIMADYGSLVYGDQTTMLNKMGKEGWELVSTYTEVATAFPNFGNSEYVTGIRENVRTSVVNFVFKRPSTGQDEVKPAKVDVKPELDSELKDTPDTEQKEQKK